MNRFRQYNSAPIRLLFYLLHISSHGYWDGFWERNDGLGAGGADPDSKSKTLRLYSQLLWSKPLPNGEVMQLEDGRSKFYLRWKDFYFSNDSITASFRYYRNRPLLDIVKKEVKD